MWPRESRFLSVDTYIYAAAAQEHACVFVCVRLSSVIIQYEFASIIASTY